MDQAVTEPSPMAREPEEKERGDRDRDRDPMGDSLGLD